MNQGSPKTLNYVFGPVPSRRLGLSLGIDLVPHKVCTFDCVYCQVGRTTRKTIFRQIFAPVDTVVEEVRKKLETVPRPDHITLAGSGEPTLHAGLGAIIDGIKRVTDVPVALLTNGSLFYDPEVRADCRKADVVLPSLDAGENDLFHVINRPDLSLTLEKIVDGLATFREEYSGQIWLEVFLVADLNSNLAQVEKIRSLAERIKPDRIQLNTAVRPTADADVGAVTEDQLSELCGLLGPKAEVIADFHRAPGARAFAATREEILAMIRRRPVTVDDIASGLGIHAIDAMKYVGELVAEKRISCERRGSHDYFRPS